MNTARVHGFLGTGVDCKGEVGPVEVDSVLGSRREADAGHVVMIRIFVPGKRPNVRPYGVEL